MKLNRSDPGEQDIAGSAGVGFGCEATAGGNRGKAPDLVIADAIGFWQFGGGASDHPQGLCQYPNAVETRNRIASMEPKWPTHERFGRYGQFLAIHWPGTG